MTADVISMRPEEKVAEAAEIQGRRGDAIAGHPVTLSKCPPMAVLLHRVASLITTEDLPPATVTVTPTGEVRVDLTGSELVENSCRRWAAALDLIVTEAAVEFRGFAARRFIASGYVDGIYWRLDADELLPTPVRDVFGIGIGPST
jgi:hypothetical protein